MSLLPELELNAGLLYLFRIPARIPCVSAVLTSKVACDSLPSMATAGVSAAALAGVLALQTGFLVLLGSFSGTPDATTAAPGTFTVPTCPPCPAPGYTGWALHGASVLSFLAGAGAVAVYGITVGVVTPGVLGYLVGSAVTSRRVARVAGRRGSPCKGEPGDSE